MAEILQFRLIHSPFGSLFLSVHCVADVVIFFFVCVSAAFTLSCVFPQPPLYGDVSVSSLHAGGEAFFSCLTGYRLQGPNVLTCRNASTPHWSGEEPHCIGKFITTWRKHNQSPPFTGHRQRPLKDHFKYLHKCHCVCIGMKSINDKKIFNYYYRH